MSPAGLLWLALAVAGYLWYFVVLEVVYLAVMALDRQKHAPPVTLASGYVVPGGLSPMWARVEVPVMLVAYALDVWGNVLLSLAFLELPREWVVTQRVTRHAEQSSGWRQAFALWIRTNLLDGFDRRGIHRA